MKSIFKHTIVNAVALLIAHSVLAQLAGNEAPVKVQKVTVNKVTNLAPVPPMGWNSWNTFQSKINEVTLKAVVDTYVSSGMRDAGYQYFVLDDGWMAMERGKKGELVADPVKFPSGIKAFADYVHAKGLKFGIYNCAGDRTCGGYPGTRGHEYEDARLYASWGVDFFKYDWCNTDSLNAREAYVTMARALQASGRPIVFSLCEWGNHQPWLWADGIGEMYRTTGDITANFAKDKHMSTWTALSMLTILDKQPAIRKYNRPNHWNDPDMLEVGNGMNFMEDRSHFSMWCMLSAPLIAGNDLSKMSEQTKTILTNKDVIALDQDSLGISALHFMDMDSVQVWIKPLSKSNLAVCFLNRASVAKAIDYKWMEHAITDNLVGTSTDFAKDTFKLFDLWAKKDLGTTKKALKEIIPAHDVLLVKLTRKSSEK